MAMTIGERFYYYGEDSLFEVKYLAAVSKTEKMELINGAIAEEYFAGEETVCHAVHVRPHGEDDKVFRTCVYLMEPKEPPLRAVAACYRLHEDGSLSAYAAVLKRENPHGPDRLTMNGAGGEVRVEGGDGLRIHIKLKYEKQRGPIKEFGYAGSDEFDFVYDPAGDRFAAGEGKEPPGFKETCLTYRLGMRAGREGDAEQAFLLFLAAAGNGYARAMAALAAAFDAGEGAARDRAAAVYWAKKTLTRAYWSFFDVGARLRGEMEALLEKVGSEDPDAFSRGDASYAADTEEQEWLAARLLDSCDFYFDGGWIWMNYEQGYDNYGYNPYGDGGLGRWTGRTREEDYQIGMAALKTETDIEKARYHLERAARGRLAEAQLELGRLLSGAAGADVPLKDARRAGYWLSKAEEQGSAEACFLLGIVELEKDPDNTSGPRHLEKAAKQGHREAQFRLAELYREDAELAGRDGDRQRWWIRGASYVRLTKEELLSGARRWYKRAAEQGHEGAAQRLAKMREESGGVMRDAHGMPFTDKCYWVDQGYCCYNISPGFIESEDLLAGPANYAWGPCPCNGDPDDENCLYMGKAKDTGRRKHFEIEDGVLKKYTGPGGKVVVPDGVTKLGRLVFYDNQTVTSVILPDGLLEIGENAFNGSNNLKVVRLSHSLKIIRKDAFRLCQGLSVCAVFDGEPPPVESISLPHGLYTVDECAFCACPKLKHLIVPGSLREIPECAFTDCYGLERVKIMPGVQKIKRLAFGGCDSLTKVLIPESVTEIDEEAFERPPQELSPEMKELKERMDAICTDMIRISTDMPRPPELRIAGVPGSFAERWTSGRGIPFEQLKKP